MITVIIPCFNAVSTIGATIQSVLRQDSAFELCVINDGSTDGSDAIIDSFGDVIRHVRIPNGGVSAARNLGLEMTRGEYVLMLDSDDLLVGGTLSARRRALETSGADVAYVDWLKIAGPIGEPIPDSVFANCLPAEKEAIEVDLATARFWSPPAAYLFRRSAIGQLRWRTELPVVQDVSFMFDLARSGSKFVHVPGIGAEYRVQDTSLSRGNPQRFISDCAAFTSQVEGEWATDGEINRAKVAALVEMWDHVAKAALVQGFPEFEIALEGLRRRTSPQLVYELAGLFRKCLSPRSCAKIVVGYLAFKRLQRRLTLPSVR